MAFVGRFEAHPLDPKRVHDDVLCGYAATNIGGRRILQLVTYGSADRQNRGAASQTLQFDRECRCAQEDHRAGVPRDLMGGEGAECRVRR